MDPRLRRGPEAGRAQEPVDRITALYCLACACFTALFHARIPGAAWVGGLYLAAAPAAWFLPARLRRTDHSCLRFAADWYPVFCFTPFYLSTARLNQGSPVPLLDPRLADVDRALFGDLLCHRFTRLLPARGFAETMAFFYFSYYLMIPGVGLWLWLRDRRRFRPFLHCVAACFYFFYLFFALAPSQGPQFYLHYGRIHWDGFFFGPMLTALLSGTESPTGAFPSSHVGIALVVTFHAWRSRRLLGAFMTLLFAGLCSAILYGAPHYCIDLPFGLLVGSIFAAVHARREGRSAVAFRGGGQKNVGSTLKED